MTTPAPISSAERIAQKALELLGERTLGEIVLGYQEISKEGGSGFGSITLRIEAAGSSKEKHIVSLETERKTR